MKIFNLPDLGEGLPDAEIIQWHVSEGDTIKEDEALVSMETAKAVVEVPSPYSGKIMKLHGVAGDVVQTGASLVSFDVLDKADTGTVAGKIEQSDTVIQQAATSVSGKSSGVKVLPAVRALAKKLDVDLKSVTPTGANGTITADDVRKANDTLNAAGPLELLRGTRRAMAAAMSHSHSEVVPVTINDDVDIQAWAEGGDYTVRIIQAMVKACKSEKALNAWFDGQAIGRRVLDNVNLGIAMDTQDGLFVPVMKDAQDKSAQAIRDEVNTLKKEVLDRTIGAEKLQGSTIVLSNFGKFAGRYANAVVVPPTVAILAVGALRQEVVVVNGDPQVHAVLPLSLTFDHRSVTGGEATRFLGVVMEELRKATV
tara:strand:+ start:55221 stop:56324 length:1104 start_codon:yes stop_codon:yes gene_type:complete